MKNKIKLLMFLVLMTPACGQFLTQEKVNRRGQKAGTIDAIVYPQPACPVKNEGSLQLPSPLLAVRDSKFGPPANCCLVDELGLQEKACLEFNLRNKREID